MHHKDAFKKTVATILIENEDDRQIGLLQLENTYLEYFSHFSSSDLLDAYQTAKNALLETYFSSSNTTTQKDLANQENILKLVIKMFFHCYRTIKSTVTQEQYFDIYEDPSIFLLTSLGINRLILDQADMSPPQILTTINRHLQFLDRLFHEMDKAQLPYIYQFDALSDAIFMTLEVQMVRLFKSNEIRIIWPAKQAYQQYLSLLKQYRPIFKESILASEASFFETREQFIGLLGEKMGKQFILEAISDVEVKIKSSSNAHQPKSNSATGDMTLAAATIPTDKNAMSSETSTKPAIPPLDDPRYATTLDRFEKLQQAYIAGIYLNCSPEQQQNLLDQMKDTLEQCLELATLAQQQALNRQLLAASAKRTTQRKKTDRMELMVDNFLNELSLRAIKQGYFKHKNLESADIDSPSLVNLLLDWQTANNAFMRSHAHFAALFKESLTWPSVIGAYQTVLTNSREYLNHLDACAIGIDSSALEGLFIDHCLDICNLALERQKPEDARNFLRELIWILERIPHGYAEARTQCQQWCDQWLPGTMVRLGTNDAQAPITPAAKTEENRHKKENRLLAKWTQTVEDLPIALASTTRLTEIQASLDAKTSEREAYQQRKQALSNLIHQKLTAIQHLEATSPKSPPAEPLTEAIGAMGPLPMVDQSIERNSLDYWNAYLHHHEALLIEAPKGRAFHTQSCLKILDTSLAKCINLKFVSLPQAMAMYQDSVALLACFEALPELMLELGQISLQRGWQLLKSIDADNERALTTLLTSIESALQLLLKVSESEPSFDTLLQQHRQQLATLPPTIGSTFRLSQETKVDPQPEAASEAKKLKKSILKALRQQKLDELSRIEAQLQLLSATEPDNLLPLANLAADLSIKKHEEKNPTVLQKIAEIEAVVTVKHTQLAALQPNEASAAPSDEETNSEFSEAEHTSQESLSTGERDEPSDFATLPFTPACLANPNYAYVIEQIKQIVQPLGKNLYVFGSALYKNQPNDLDLLCHYQDMSVVSALQDKGARIVGEIKKNNRHVLQLEWHGVKLDINLSHKTWQQHAQQLDFTVGAIYHNLNTVESTAVQAEVLEHFQRKELHCAQPGGSLAMLRHDPSILFRALHLERHEGYRWSEEFTTAVNDFAQQANNPFYAMNPDRLYQVMERLFEHGHARANLERLIQLKLFEKLFGSVATLNETQKDQVYFMARQAANSCDSYRQPPSLMFYAIHWPGLCQNPVIDRHAIAGQSTPRIELQKGPCPKWNPYTHQYNSQFLNYYAVGYNQHLAYQASLLAQPPCQAQPPRQTHNTYHKKNKKPFAHPPGTHRPQGNMSKR